MIDRSVVLAGLARALATADPTLSLSARLCNGGVDVLDVGGGSITIANAEPERVTLHATDPVAARLEDLEEVLGEGPSLDAYATGAPVLADLGDAESSRRWPVFAGAALRGVGTVTVLAVPMRPDRQTVGVFAVHDLPNRPLDELTGSAQFLADAMAVALVRNTGPWEDGNEGPWPARARIHQAIGMVVAQLRLRPDDAEALLRAHAYSLDTTLADIADHVVTRRLVFSYDADDDIRNGDS
jgi:hypothetical protein